MCKLEWCFMDWLTFRIVSCNWQVLRAYLLMPTCHGSFKTPFTQLLWLDMIRSKEQRVLPSSVRSSLSSLPHFVLLSHKSRRCYEEVSRTSRVLLMLLEGKGLWKSDYQSEHDQHDCILVFFFDLWNHVRTVAVQKHQASG